MKEEIDPKIKGLLSARKILYIFKTVNYEDSSKEITIDDNIYKKVKMLTHSFDKFKSDMDKHVVEQREFMRYMKYHISKEHGY